MALGQNKQAKQMNEPTDDDGDDDDHDKEHLPRANTVLRASRVLTHLILTPLCEAGTSSCPFYR